jgi:hypothetical protein
MDARHAVAVPPLRQARKRWEGTEFPLNGMPCVVCGLPALRFVPSAGVRHKGHWCGVADVGWQPVSLTPAKKTAA